MRPKILEDLKKIETRRNILHNIILALLVVDNEPIRGRTKLQKMVFLLSQIIPELKENVKYNPYNYGMYDENVDTALEFLESENIIKRIEEPIDNEKYIEIFELLDKSVGEEALNKLKQYIDYIKQIKEQYNDLTEDEVLAIVYTLYPEYAQYSEKKEEIEKKKLDIAINLYKKGKVSIGLASKIAEKSIHDFVDLLKKRGIKINIEDESNL